MKSRSDLPPSQKTDGFTFLLPRRYQEAFLGNLKEDRQQMIDQGVSRWWVTVVSLFKIPTILRAAFQIRWSEFFDSKKQRKRNE